MRQCLRRGERKRRGPKPKPQTASMSKYRRREANARYNGDFLRLYLLIRVNLSIYTDRGNRSGIMLYQKYQSLPSSELTPPTPFPTIECVPPPGTKGRGWQHSLAVRRRGEPILPTREMPHGTPYTLSENTIIAYVVTLQSTFLLA